MNLIRMLIGVFDVFGVRGNLVEIRWLRLELLLGVFRNVLGVVC